MSDAGKWTWGGVLAVFAVFGLMLAAHAQDTGAYVQGLMVFAFGAAASFWLIARGNGPTWTPTGEAVAPNDYSQAGVRAGWPACGDWAARGLQRGLAPPRRLSRPGLHLRSAATC